MVPKFIFPCIENVLVLFQLGHGVESTDNHEKGGDDTEYERLSFVLLFKVISPLEAGLNVKLETFGQTIATHASVFI